MRVAVFVMLCLIAALSANECVTGYEKHNEAMIWIGGFGLLCSGLLLFIKMAALLFYG